MRKMHVVLSAPSMFRFMSGQPARLRQIGYDISVVAAESSSLDKSCQQEGCSRIKLEIPRNITLVRDLIAFIQLTQLWIRSRPDAVMLSGPKAIFLGSIAAFIADVPVRLSIYHGMRQQTLKFPLRTLINWCDRVAFLASTTVLAVSKSLVDAIKAECNDPLNKVVPISPGTANGINFNSLSENEEKIALVRNQVRGKFGIGNADNVLLFLARITEDKGLVELPYIYAKILERHPNTHMLMVGAQEVITTEGIKAFDKLSLHPKVHLVGHVEDVETYYAAADVLVFPSHREGFGMAIIEAGFLRRPTVAYNVTGVKDAVVNGVTGTLVNFANLDQFVTALSMYMNDYTFRKEHGNAARNHAMTFSADAVWENYRAILEPH